MELKSIWFVQAAIAFQLLLMVAINGTPHGDVEPQGSILFFFLLVVSIAIMLLFYSEKTKKLGALACILWGFLIVLSSNLGMLYFAINTPVYEAGIKKMSVIPGEVLPVGVFLIIAGILQIATKIEGWYVALIGVLIQFFSGLLQFYDASTMWSGAGIVVEVYSAKSIAGVGITNALIALVGILPVVLLYFNKTKKIGAITSIIMGIVALVMIANFLNLVSTPHTVGYIVFQADGRRIVYVVIFSILQIIIGALFMLGGIFHFKEKI